MPRAKKLPTLPVESCGTCRFWKQLETELQQPGQPLRGLCRRYPPIGTWADDTGKQVITGPHPVTFAGVWCGEFSLAKE